MKNKNALLYKREIIKQWKRGAYIYLVQAFIYIFIRLYNLHIYPSILSIYLSVYFIYILIRLFNLYIYPSIFYIYSLYAKKWLINLSIMIIISACEIYGGIIFKDLISNSVQTFWFNYFARGSFSCKILAACSLLLKHLAKWQS